MKAKEPVFPGTKANIRAACARYGIEPGSFERAKGGVINANYIIAAASGRYVLRASAHGMRTDEDIRYEIAFIEALRTRGVPAVRILPNTEGDPLTIHLDQNGVRWQVVMMEFVKGRHLRHTDTKLMDEVARTQARMHRIALKHVRPKHSVTEDLAERMEWFEREIPRGALLWRSFGAEQEVMKVYADVKADIKKAMPAIRALPHGECHLDYDSDNIMVSKGHIAAVIDFDDIENAPFIWDVGNSLWWWFNESTSRTHEHILETYLLGYTAERKLTRAELDMLPLFVRLRNIMILTFRSANHPHCVTARQLSKWIAFDKTWRGMRI